MEIKGRIITGIKQMNNPVVYTKLEKHICHEENNCAVRKYIYIYFGGGSSIQTRLLGILSSSDASIEIIKMTSGVITMVEIVRIIVIFLIIVG